MHDDSTHLMLISNDRGKHQHRAVDDDRAQRLAHLRRRDGRAERIARLARLAR